MILLYAVKQGLANDLGENTELEITNEVRTGNLGRYVAIWVPGKNVREYHEKEKEIVKCND